jgi:hypothetical protein
MARRLAGAARSAVLVALALGMLAVLPRAAAAEVPGDAERAGVVAFTTQWLSLVSAGDYAAAYAHMCPAFQKANPFAAWVDGEKKFAAISGKLVEQDNLTLGAWARNPAGIEPGDYFKAYACAKFGSVDLSRMEVTVREEPDGGIHILFYQRMYLDRPSEKALRALQRKFDGARFPTERVSKEDMDQYYSEIQALSGWHAVQSGDTYVILGAESDTEYIFTTPSNPAHPAVIKLRNAVYQGASGIMKSGHYAGDEAEYRKWSASIGPQGGAGAPLSVLSDATPPPPPSFAVHPEAKPPQSPVTFLVNTIPASAKFVNFAQMTLGARPIGESQAADIGRDLSKSFDGMADLARQYGGNLVVVFSQEHGISVPIAQCDRPLVLKTANSVVTALLFDWDGAAGLSDKERAVRFTTAAPPPGVASIAYKIELKAGPTGVPKAFWVYANISRFVKDAIGNGFDTVSVASSQDPAGEDVWMPACDEPARVSVSKPELDVSLYKRTEAGP